MDAPGEFEHLLPALGSTGTVIFCIQVVEILTNCITCTAADYRATSPGWLRLISADGFAQCASHRIEQLQFREWFCQKQNPLASCVVLQGLVRKS